ncbi:MAG: sacsin N-terminal ATP-binding-like domain-containing protein [Methanosarcinaceae archaeon]
MSEGKLLRKEAKKYRTNIYNLIKQNLVAYSGFVYLVKELIQNSDDSSRGESVEIIIDFKDEMLSLRNNTYFNENDWEKIEEIASGNKENDPNSTGRFGIGFTSVFKICDDLKIHSIGKSKKFELSTLEWIPYEKPRYPEINITEFEFFWRKNPTDSGNEIDAVALTEENLLDFQKETLDSICEDIHFLNNVITIEIQVNGKRKQKIEIKKKKPENVSSSSNDIMKEERIIIVTNPDNSKKILPYLIYTQNVDTYFTEEYKCKVARKKPLLLSIAVNEDSLKNGRVFCTLPTSDYLECLFDLNCDFWPDTSRKHIIMEMDDLKGKYNLKIFSFVPDMLMSITEDLKNDLPKTSFYNLLSSFLIKDNTFFKKYSETYLSLLKTSRSNIIFLQGKWLSANKVKYTEEKYLLPFLRKVNFLVVPQEDLNFLPLFKELGMKEFGLNDLLNELKSVPNDIELEKSIFSSKEELKSIFHYFEYKGEDVKRRKSEINSLNIFLTNKGRLINAEIHNFYTLPDELLPFKSDFDLPEIDSDLLNKFEYLLSNSLRIFKNFSDFDLVAKILKDFESINFPIKLEDSVAYLNTKEKLIYLIDFLDLYLKNSVNFKNKGYIKHKNERYGPKDKQYNSIGFFYTDFEKLPIILSSSNLLYPWKNNEVFILNSTSEQKFAARYNIESLDPDILDEIKKYTSYNRLRLKNIVEFVEKSTKNEEKFEVEFLLLLYKLILGNSIQLSENGLKNRIRKLPIFVDVESNLCCLENNEKKVFLKSSYNDRFGMAKVLDVKLIRSVPSFKEKILKDHFGIEDLTFDAFVKNYFESIFENNLIDTSRKLDLIKELNEYYPKIGKSTRLKEINLALKKTKLIYCTNNKYYYPYNEFIYLYAISAEKEFASMHGLEIMQTEVENMARKYDLVKVINLKNILEYVIDDVGKRNFVLNEHYLKILYRLILEKKAELNNENLSTIQKLKIFSNNSGNPTTLENKLLHGDYPLPQGIRIDEILDESVISKVAGFKEEVLIGIFNLKLLDYETFIVNYFKVIFANNNINKEVKRNLFKELYTRFAKLEENNLFHSIKNTLVNSKIVYCQDGDFHYPVCKNLFIKSELVDEIFGEDYLYPDFDMNKYKHIFKELGVKESVESHLIVDFINESISNVEVNSQLINKMKRVFISINRHWDYFVLNVEDFSPLSNLEWLPASNSSNILYKPSELYTQNSRQNTRPYLEHLDDVKYLDINDADLKEKDYRRGIKVEFLKILKLNKIDQIPVSMLIDNIEAASKNNRLLTTKMNFLNIYELLNNKINHVEISRLNTFPSFQIIYTDNGKPLYFKPSEIFKRDLQFLFGTEYFGYLNSKYVAKCENLLNKLGVLEEPNVDNAKCLLEKINKKYEPDNLNVSSENDRSIIINCLEYLDKHLDYIEEIFVTELRKLPIFCNKNNLLLSADSCILEDNPILCQQFGDALSDYFIKLNVKYSGLIERLEIRGLTQLIKKEMQICPDPLKMHLHSNFTQKMQNVSKLMPRIKAGNRELDTDKWLNVKQDIEVYTYDHLCVSRYIDWNNKRYDSNIDSVNCYLEIENGVLNIIYVKGHNHEIQKSLAYELFEEMHSNINQNFMSIILMLLRANSYDEMDENLTDSLYPVLENADSTVKSNRIIDEGSFEDTDSQNDSLIYGEGTTEEVTLSYSDTFVENSGPLDISASNKEDVVDLNATEASIVNGQKTTEEAVTIEADNGIEKVNVFDTTGQSINMSVLNHNNDIQKTSNQIRDGNNINSVTQCLTSFDEGEEAVTVGRTTSPTERTNFRKKLKEKYHLIDSASLKNENDFEVSPFSVLGDNTPISLEEKETIKEKTKKEILHNVERSSSDNESRGYSSRLDPNVDDEIADAEVRMWYKGKCQICERTFKKEGSNENFSEVTKLLETKEQGVTHTANKVCLCSYHASILKKGRVYINFNNLVNNKLDITIYGEYENGYRDKNCHIKYNEMHFLQLKALLALNSDS